MSELTNQQRDQAHFHWHLLASVSMAAMVAAACASDAARAEDDAERPTVWIELGGQLERLSNPQEQFSPFFVADIPNTLFSPLSVEKPLQYSFGGEGSVIFEPIGSDWVFSASLRFGRSNGVKQKQQLIHNGYVPVGISKYGQYDGGFALYPDGHAKFENVKSQQSQTRTILDFQAGKDVGLGMFGNRGSSIFSAGVRFAQFTSKANISMRVEPDVNYPTAPIHSFAAKYAFYHHPMHFHDYAALLNSQRSFLGIGPSIAWNASTPFIGDSGRGELTLDWGANAAVLFGRQKVIGHHQTTTISYYGHAWNGNPNQDTPHLKPGFLVYAGTAGISHQSHRGMVLNRARSIFVPNLGGFAGVSFLYSNAKVSLGYRADFFLGATDVGIDAHKSATLGFYGPFASVSVGIP